MKLRLSFTLVVALAAAGPPVPSQVPDIPPPAVPDEVSQEAEAPPPGPPGLEWGRVRRPEFLSVVRDEGGKALALRTSIVRFEPIDGEDRLGHVDLVGAVHVGDRAYYERLNAILAAYDVVLFEMAHKEDPRGDLEKRRGEPDFMKLLGLDPAGMLGLESQVARIDYGKANFVHADTSLPDAMERRGDDWVSVMAGLLADLRRQSNLDGRPGGNPRNGEDAEEGSDPFGGLFGFGTGGDPLALKRRFAGQLESQGLDGIPGFTTLNDLLIAERNKVAMKRFEEQVAAGRRRIAIFYGAAHMRDFTQRLVVDHGLRPVALAWIEAWDLRDPAGAASRRSQRRGGIPGEEIDRDAAHDLVDRLFDLLEEALREEAAPPARRPGR